MKLPPMILFFFICQIAWSQTEVLPIMSNGKWGAIDENGKIIIEPFYNYLSPFVKEVAIVKKGRKYGLLNTQNQVIKPVVFDQILRTGQVENDGRSYYVTRKDSLYGLVDDVGKEMFSNEYHSIRFEDKDIVELVKDSTSFFYWIKSGIVSEEGCPTGITSFKSKNSVWVESDSLFTLYSNKGIKLMEQALDSNVRLTQRENLHLVQEKNHLQVFNDTSQVIDHSGFFQIHWFDGIIDLSTDTTTAFFSISNQELFLDMPYREIKPIDEFYFASDGDYWGVVDIDGNELIPVKFNRIQYVRNGYQVELEGMYGQYSSSFERIIPPEFDNIIALEDSLYLVLLDDLMGIYNGLGEQIVSPDYDNIEYADKVLKGYKRKAMTIFTLKDDYTIREQQKFENVAYVKVNYSASNSNDTSLMVFNGSGQAVTRGHGWFEKELVKTKKNGDVITYKRWGKKGENDSLQITPRYSSIHIIDSLGITLAFNKTGIKDQNVNWQDVKRIPTERKQRIISNKSGKTLAKGKVFRHLKIEDFNQVNFCRGYGNSGIILLDRSFNVIRTDVRRVKAISEGMTPVEFGGYPRITKEKNKGVRLRPFFAPFQFRVKNVFNRDLWKCKIYIPKSSWNFLDENGQLAFDFHFKEVRKFKNGIALVKQEKWGVVNKDTVILPMQFDTIIRMGSDEYECLAVIDSSYKTTFLSNTNGTEIDLPYTRLKLGVDNQIVAYTGAGWEVLGDDLKKVTNGDFKNLEGVIDDYAIVRRGSKLGLATFNGERVLSSRYKSVFKMIDDTLLIAGSRKRKGVVNIRNEVVVPFFYKSIEVRGDSLVAESSMYDAIYSRSGKVIRKKKEVVLKVDSLTGDYLQGKIGKSKIRTASGDKIKLKKCGCYDLKGGKVICRKDWDYIVMDYALDTVLLTVKNYKLYFFDKETYLFRKGRCFGLITEKGRILLEPNYKEIKKVFGKYYVGLTGSEAKFIDLKGREVLTKPIQSIEAESSGLILCKSITKSWFLDNSLKNPFYEVYESAYSFKGHFTSVKEDGKWVTLHLNGTKQSVPSYEDMIPLKGERFFVKTENNWGLYHKSGEQLLENKYETIEYIEQGKFKVVRNGELGYFHVTKGWLYNPFEN